jgi:hypothetical protein
MPMLLGHIGVVTIAITGIGIVDTGGDRCRWPLEFPVSRGLLQWMKRTPK